MSKHVFNFPTKIYFGPGTRHDTAAFLKENGVRRPLIVTDKGVADQPFLKELAVQLTDSTVFPGIWGNPVKSQVLAGVKAYREHRADGVVAVGGGAAIDVAKAILVLVNHTGDLFDYEDGKPGALDISREIPFWIALPTTSGTGSEVGRSAVISDDATHVKKIIFSPKLLTRAVFADPEVTLGLPAKITAATGMDALTHNAEAYLAKDYHPICDGIALEGLKLAAKHLVRAVKEPSNLEARTGMMMASMMGAIAFQKGLGLTHSCAHALSTVADMHHGLANGIMIDYALKRNIEAVPDRFRAMAQAAGLSDTSPTSFLKWLIDLKRDTGIPAKLLEAGIKPDHLTRLADIAMADTCHLNNPRPCTRNDFVEIFKEALG